MATTIRLVNGGYVTRAWGPDGFFFEVQGTDEDGYVKPTRKEMLKIGALFRQAGLKTKKADEGKGGDDGE